MSLLHHLLMVLAMEGARAVLLDALEPGLVTRQAEVVEQPPHLLGGRLGQLLDREE